MFGAPAGAQQQCTWKTVDDFVYPGSTTNSPSGIAAHDSRVFVSGTTGSGPDTGRWLVRRKKGSTWATVDDFLPAPAYRAHAAAIAVDQKGVVYVGGGTESTAAVPWVIRVSKDKGQTWFVSDTSSTVGQVRALTSQKSGPTFAGGNVAVGADQWHWIVKSTSNNGATWGLSDQQPPTLGAIVVTGLGANESNVYAAGYNFVDYQYRWQVRRRVGGTWSLVDDWMPLPNTSSSAFPTSVAVLQGGVVLVAGTFAPENQTPRWTVRRSANSGATWAIVDDRVDCRAASLSVSRSGQEVLLAGRCPINGADTWVVYRSTNGGVSWSLSDSWVPGPGVGSAATAVGFDGDTAYAAGSTLNAGQRRWIVRKRVCGNTHDDDDDDDDDDDHHGHGRGKKHDRQCGR
ncbi:MAG: hypothetical protein JNK82_23200 [Myxococcaceae bacterium]|nr:hypothetical protein [Myxococcaceae bacterium]